MARCAGCDAELPEGATTCDRCGRDLAVPEVGEERHQASVADGTCIICGGRRPWWSLFTWGTWSWATCQRCGAHYCRRCRQAKKDWNALEDKITYTWTCRYCQRQNERVYDQSWAD